MPSAALALISMSAFEGIRNVHNNLSGQFREPSALFAKSAEMWAAVRSQTRDDERIANNPLFLSGLTSWPINLSWALMANRRSCYASNGFGPFAPRTEMAREEIDVQFDRIFSGRPENGDLNQLATQYNCAVVVVTPQDGAWNNDPFAQSDVYRLIESKADAWRIYRRS